MPHGTYTAGDQAAHALVRCEYSGAAAMAEYSDTQFGQVPRCTKMEQAGQCATSHLCGRRYERHAGSLVTGNYQEDGLPAPGTPCMGGCVAEAGVWGPNRCWTSAEQNGTAWGAPCYEAPSQSAAEQFALCEEFEMPMYGVKCKTHCSCDAGCQKRGDCCLSDDAMAKACAPPAIEEVCSSVRTHACKRQLNHDYRIIEDAFITVYCPTSVCFPTTALTHCCNGYEKRNAIVYSSRTETEPYSDAYCLVRGGPARRSSLLRAMACASLR